jgi:hypothetical protein
MNLQTAECENVKNANTGIGLAGRYGVLFANALYPLRRGSRKKNARKGFGKKE